MKITKKLQEWLVANAGVSADASEDEFRKAAGEALTTGGLSGELYVELTKDADADAASSFEKKLDAMMSAITKTNERINGLESSPKAEEAEEVKDFSEAKLTEKTKTLDGVAELAGESEKAHSGSTVNVIEAHTRYSTTKSAAHYPTQDQRGTKHPLAGQPVRESGVGGNGRQLYHPSERDKAINGAWIKWRIANDMGRKCPAKLAPTQHDLDLLKYAIQNEKWCGVWGGSGSEDEGAVGVRNETLRADMKAAMMKAAGEPVYDEAAGASASGGQEIAPEMFDADVILTPLLFGEVFPRVNLKTVVRGSRIEGASFDTTTNTMINSVGNEKTQITLFDTDGFISEFNTNIHVAQGGILMGLDFLSDSAVDISSIVTETYGQQLMVWLDEQICVGDGTNEPDGVKGATGITNVEGLAGLTVGIYESLLFSVAKPYRMGVAKNRIAYVSRESVYQSARSIAVSGNDERRVFGLETNFHEAYRLLGYDNAIHEHVDLDNTILFGNFARYRMYRRLGATFNVTTEGQTLVQNNRLLLTMRARFGGQVEDGSAFAETTDLP